MTAAAAARAPFAVPGRRLAFGDGVLGLALPLTVASVVLFLAPLILLVDVSLYATPEMTERGLASWVKFFGDPFYLQVVVDTLALGLKTVVATTIVGYPLALLFCAAPKPVQRVLLFIVIVPLLTSVVVRTFAWIVILGNEGVLDQVALGLGLTSAPLQLLQTETGLIIALTQIEMPLLLLPLISVMTRIDPNLIDASQALGASRWRTLFKVILPLSLPGLVAGALLVFASSVSAFISQSVIGGTRLIYMPLVIWQQSLVVYNWPFAAVVALTLLASVMIVITLIAALGRHAQGRHLG